MEGLMLSIVLKQVKDLHQQTNTVVIIYQMPLEVTYHYQNTSLQHNPLLKTLLTGIPKK